MSDLFREEARHFRASADHGGICLAAPPGLLASCLLLAAALATALVFLASGSYARKETVSGIIDSDIAIKGIVAPRRVVIERIHVHESGRVTAGAPVARVRALTAIDEAERQQTLTEYDRQLAALASRIGLVEAQQHSEQARLEETNRQLLLAINRHREVVRLQALKRDDANQTLAAAQSLYDEGLLSRLEWGRLRENALAASQQLARLVAEQTARQTEIVSNQVAIEQLPARYGREINALEQEASRIRQQIAGIRGELAFDLKAPASGIVARVYGQVGETLTADQMIASVLPVDANLQARLFIPSRSIGFVAAGQRVNLLYDAFPHQQFGTYAGTIETLSRHPVSGVEAGTSGTDVPMFEAVVKLERDRVRAYGESLALRHGMTLRADIVLEERSLWQWLLEPLHILRGRT